MLAFPPIATALVAALGGLTTSVLPTTQDPEFLEIWRVTAREWVDFVHVESQVPELFLGIHSERALLTTWSERGGAVPRRIDLSQEEKFVVSINRRLMGILRYPFNCLSPEVVPGWTLWTEVRFPKGLPPLPPLPPPPDPPGPPPPIEGPYQVHLSESGELLLYTQTGLEDHMTAQVLILGQSSGPAPEFVRTGAYTNLGQGQVQTSDAVRRIAQAEGTSIRILDERGTEMGRVAGGAGFSLSPSGRHLAVLGERSVFFHSLNATGEPVSMVRVDVDTAPLGISFVEASALIRCRGHLVLTDAATGAVSWTVEASVGTYSSADLALWHSGELLVAAGRLEVLRAPARLDGVHVTGLARAHVDLLSQAGQPMSPTFTFETERWTRASPRVQLLVEARRLLTHSGDVVLITERLP